MNKATYQAARSLVRANGNFALRWLPIHVEQEYRLILDAGHGWDHLAERASAEVQGWSGSITMNSPQHVFEAWCARHAARV